MKSWRKWIWLWERQLVSFTFLDVRQRIRTCNISNNNNWWTSFTNLARNMPCALYLICLFVLLILLLNNSNRMRAFMWKNKKLCYTNPCFVDDVTAWFTLVSSTSVTRKCFRMPQVWVLAHPKQKRLQIVVKWRKSSLSGQFHVHTNTNTFVPCLSFNSSQNDSRITYVWVINLKR